MIYYDSYQTYFAEAYSQIYKLFLEKNLNQSNATCDVLQRLSHFRLIYLHYASVQNKMEFKLASVSALEEEIQRKERKSSALVDEARQKVVAHVRCQLHVGVVRC